jgi:amino-acid N-acetyltransferase
VTGTGRTTLRAVRPATQSDYETVVGLLQAANLPLAGVPRALAGFYVAEDRGRILGTVGLELYGTDGLLRSAVVDPAARGTGLGHALVGRLLGDARERGIGAVYLLTTTAEGWFPRFGFSRIERDDVPDQVRASVEFREACPASAVVMRAMLSELLNGSNNTAGSEP